MRSQPMSAVGVVAALLLLTGCQAGPQLVAPGAYRLLSTSSSTSPSTSAALAVVANTVTVTTGSDTWTSVIGEPGQSVVLCPPSGRGAPSALGEPLSLGEIELTRPAIFGDCGQTRPRRVTVVDLDSYNGGETRPPFTRWAEFCNTVDPDCP